MARFAHSGRLPSERPATGGRIQAKLARNRRRRAVDAGDLAVFTRQFSVMIGAGLPLVQCLEILGTQAEDGHFGALILAVRGDVQGGASLAEAMRRHPEAFDSLFTSMIEVGEAAGILDTILKRLATHMEKAARLKGQIKSAMIYPVAIILIATVVVAAILWKVIPTFATLFAGLGADLPLPTRVVISLSSGVVRFGPLLMAALVAGVFGFRRYYRTPAGRRTVDGTVLKLPVLGVLVRKIAVARFCRTLSTLLAAGVSMLKALDITARTAGNAVVEDAICATRRGIERGETMAAPLRQTDVFPPMVVQMIGVGEATGALEAMLAKISDFYEQEVDTAAAGLLTLLEPLMMALVGVVVGGIVIAMYMPIFGLIGQLTGG